MQFLELPDDWNFTSFADNASFLSTFPNEVQLVVAAARDFWQLMYGAHIRYNCLLQEKHGTSAVRQEMESKWNDWMLSLQSFPWSRWNTDFLWELTRRHHRQVRGHTVKFVEAWINGVRSGAAIQTLDELVVRQERANKKSRARLNPAAKESINKWVGIDDLNYRLNVARNIISDNQFKKGQQRMLVADEVGLGKTIVAKGLIARLISDRVEEGITTPLKVTYICSNQVIAHENVGKLDV